MNTNETQHQGSIARTNEVVVSVVRNRLRWSETVHDEDANAVVRFLETTEGVEGGSFELAADDYAHVLFTMEQAGISEGMRAYVLNELGRCVDGSQDYQPKADFGVQG